jgi:hypothetical protein
MDMLGAPTPTRDIPDGIEHDERSIRHRIDEKLGCPIAGG